MFWGSFRRNVSKNSASKISLSAEFYIRIYLHLPKFSQNLNFSLPKSVEISSLKHLFGISTFFLWRQRATSWMLWSIPLKACHPSSSERFTVSCLESAGTVKSGETSWCCLDEHRQDAGSFVSLRGSGASTSISHIGKPPPSYLIPFILGLVNSDACKSGHRLRGNGKVKTHIAIGKATLFNLDDLVCLEFGKSLGIFLLHIKTMSQLKVFKCIILNGKFVILWN